MESKADSVSTDNSEGLSDEEGRSKSKEEQGNVPGLEETSTLGGITWE
jgi:hypothetical protein